jgi:flagellar biosynthesis protein FlhG
MSVQLDTLRRYVAERPQPRLREGAERVVLVGSGKGGVGASSIAGLIAVMAAADGKEVLLMDADESHGALPLMLGVEPRQPFARLRGGELTPEDLLVPLGHGLDLLPAGGPAEPEERLSGPDRRALLRRAAALFGRFDLVVIDAGSRLESVLAAAALGVARLLAVTAPDRIAAAATYALVKTIDSRTGPLPVDLLFNRCRLAAATEAFHDLDGATRHFLRRSLDFAGAVPDDDRLRARMNAGTPLQDVAGLATPAAAACHELAVRLARQLHARPPAVVAPRLSPRR